MHRSAFGSARAERIKQVTEREASVFDFASYVPISDAVQKLGTWNAQGAEISYLSSHNKVEDVQKDEHILRKYDFPPGKVHFRRGDESYRELVMRIMPDVLVEDDCESIGGEKEMVSPQLDADSRSRIKSIVVKEFGGIDHLSDDIAALANP